MPHGMDILNIRKKAGNGLRFKKWVVLKSMIEFSTGEKVLGPKEGVSMALENHTAIVTPSTRRLKTVCTGRIVFPRKGNEQRLEGFIGVLGKVHPAS